MSVKGFLQWKWHLAGLDAPAFSWVAAGFLIVVTLIFVVRLFYLVRREVGIHEEVRTKIVELRASVPKLPGHGFPAAALEELRKALDSCKPLQHASVVYRGHLLLIRTSAGDEEFWAADSAAVAFDEDSVLDSRINRSFYDSFPGLITGFGLLVTFFAILVALLDVQVKDDQIKGLEQLISGLSGKFLSSVTALLLASVFLPLVRWQLHGLSSSRMQLVAGLDELIPRRTPIHELHRIYGEIERQAVELRHLNTVLPETLTRSVGESMNPTLMRMVESVEELNRVLRATEAAKKDSITGSLDALLRELQRSLVETLGGIGEQFRESISQQAQGQFDSVAQSLASTTQLLESLNQQASGNQQGMRDLMVLAERSTRTQMEMGQSQVQELTSVLRELMAQLQSSTTGSLSQMNVAQTAVLAELSSCVASLSQNLRESVEAANERSSQAAMLAIAESRSLVVESTKQAGDVVRQQGAIAEEQLQRLQQSHDRSIREIQETTAQIASRLSGTLEGTMLTLVTRLDATSETMRLAIVGASSAAAGAATTSVEETRKLAQETSSVISSVLDHHRIQMDRTEEMRLVLGDTLSSLHDNLRGYRAATSEIRSAVDAGKAVALELRTVGAHMSSMQDANKKIGELSSVQVARLSESVAAQEAQWQRIQGSMENYGRLFTQVECDAAKMLQEIATHTERYTEVTREGFESLVTLSNDAFASAVQRLSGSVNELDEKLSDLSDALGRSASFR